MYIHIYIYIFIHIESHLFYFPKSVFLNICSYIVQMTLDLIGAFRIAIYSTKHTQHTKLHFQKSNSQKSICYESSTFIRNIVFCLFLWPPLANLKC